MLTVRWTGIIEGGDNAMFRCVVYKLDRGKFKVEATDSECELVKGIYYKSLNALPHEIKDKVKQLMWVRPDDQTITDTLGIRIGENIFWIV